MNSKRIILPTAITLLLASIPASAQPPSIVGSRIRYGQKVPAEVKMIYDRGLKYLATNQNENGTWPGGDQGSGITGIATMAFLAHGEDPNFGPYAENVRRGVRKLIQGQNSSTGFLPNSMYHHGFATLSLAEAYGSVDDTMLWAGQKEVRSVGQALELAVRCAVTSQKNNRWGGWRYSPSDTNADTSVAGAVLMGILAARNAGIEVPDECIDKALQYYKNSTSDTGMVAYSGGVGGHGESMNRTAVCTLVLSVGKRKEWKEHKAALNHLTTRLEHNEMGYPFYFRYYMSQALFQADFDSWTKWKEENIRILRDMQQDDGSFQSGHGPAYGTGMALLSLALDYRFLPIYER